MNIKRWYTERCRLRWWKAIINLVKCSRSDFHIRQTAPAPSHHFHILRSATDSVAFIQHTTIQYKNPILLHKNMNKSIINVAIIGIIFSSNVLVSAFECSQEESTGECEASTLIKWPGFDNFPKRDIFQNRKLVLWVYPSAFQILLLDSKCSDPENES